MLGQQAALSSPHSPLSVSCQPMNRHGEGEPVCCHFCSRTGVALELPLHTLDHLGNGGQQQQQVKKGKWKRRRGDVPLRMEGMGWGTERMEGTFLSD